MPYIGKSNDGFGIRERFVYLASGGATTISGADVNARTLQFNDPEYVDVFLNGVKLKKDTDFNLDTSNTVAGLAALSANDEVEVIVHDVFTLADMVSASSGGSFGGAITVKGDLSLTADAAALKFGVDSDVTVTHDTDDGLVFKSTATADDNPFLLTIQTGETDIAANDVLGQINFQAPDEGTGTDAILVAAGIAAISEGDFSSSSNATKLSFQTGASEAASEKMSLSSAGVLTVSGNIVGSGTITGGGLLTTGGDIVIPDGGSIGSASDTNAVTISSAGVVTISTNTDSTGAANGALVAHSAGFADDVYIGDFLNVGGDINVVDDLVVNGGVIDLKNTGSQSQLRLYCESSNAHYAALQAPAHSAFSGNTVLTLPATTDTIVARTTTDTLTNKTLTSPVLNTATVGTSITPASADGATLGTAALEFSDLFLADAGEILFGADQDVILRHDHNSGLIIDRANTSDNSPTSLTLSTGETDIQADDVIGVINFQAPDEGTGTDAILVAAGIAAISEGDFSASSNATKLSFQTGASEAAAEKMSLSSAGNLTVSNDVSVGDNLTLASDGARIDFGADGEISLTHVHNSGVQFSDSDKLLFGDGGDLEIYHDGSDSIIADVGTGNLQIRADDFFVMNGSSEVMIRADTDSFVKLYFDNAEKLATSNTGVDITGAFTATSGSTITTADNTTQLTLISTDADATVGPRFDLKRDSGSPADGDTLGRMRYLFDNDAAEQTEGVRLDGIILDASDGTEDIQFELSTLVAGTLRSRLKLGTETVFNEASQDIDFRVESLGDVNSFVIEGATKGIGMGTDDPTIDSSLAGVSVPSGSRVLHIHDADCAYLKLSDPATGSNRGAQFALINTTAILNNCEDGGLILGSGNTATMTISGSNDTFFTRNGGVTVTVNRNTDDGALITLQQGQVTEGTISVSGNTISYNAFSGSHWSRLVDNSKPTILRGTIIETIDQMCVWYQAEYTHNGEDKSESIALPEGKSVGDTFSYETTTLNPNEKITVTAKIVKAGDVKHAMCKVSDTADSKKVYGVFLDWDNDEIEELNDMYVCAVGTNLVRIHKDVTVEAGDLLSSNGDGTAKVQDDDIIRSKTIGKVTAAVKQETYSDGSYTVPCALYCG